MIGRDDRAAKLTPQGLRSAAAVWLSIVIAAAVIWMAVGRILINHSIGDTQLRFDALRQSSVAFDSQPCVMQRHHPFEMV
jgi:hypothetical protein